MWFYFAESIINEALRLSSASIMIRVASDDFILTLDSGQEAAIRKGDYIALYPRLIHLDPDIYPNPLVNTLNTRKYMYIDEPLCILYMYISIISVQLLLLFFITEKVLIIIFFFISDFYAITGV